MVQVKDGKIIIPDGDIGQIVTVILNDSPVRALVTEIPNVFDTNQPPTRAIICRLPDAQPALPIITNASYKRIGLFAERGVLNLLTQQNADGTYTCPFNEPSIVYGNGDLYAPFDIKLRNAGL